jgi:cyclopropane fatty-acyl-phospholipid synthase-like methyltransferase
MSDTHQMVRFDNSKDLGKWYDEKYTEMGGGWKIGEEGANKILDWIGVKPGSEGLLLDVGSGDGDFVRTSAQRIRSIGIDLSSVGVEYAVEFSKAMGQKDAEFLVADIEQYQHMPTFDYITSLGSIEHCIHIHLALLSCFNNLKDNGLFYVLVPNEAWQHFDQPQETTHTDEEWTTLFTDAEFKVIDQKRNNDLSEFLLRKDL